MKKAVSFIGMFLLFSALIAQTDVKNSLFFMWGLANNMTDNLLAAF